MLSKDIGDCLQMNNKTRNCESFCPKGYEEEIVIMENSIKIVCISNNWLMISEPAIILLCVIVPLAIIAMVIICTM